jgi:NADPH:quinone reductase-like Zn-dependent oxidoreductase
MQAYELAQFGLDALTLVERPTPVAEPGTVLVRVRAVSLNYRDLLVVKGHYDPRLQFPRVPCSDGAGVIAAVGAGVTGWQVGERVMGAFFPNWHDGDLAPAKLRPALGGDTDGLLREYAVLSATGIVRTPAHLSDEEAATLPCAALTAWNALCGEGPIAPGDVVLLQGTGGVSLFGLQIAKLCGARAIITSSSRDKLLRAQSLGAEAGIDYRAVPEWDKRARELTNGLGVDHVVEVGGAGTLNRSLRAVRPGGRISLIGVLAGGSGPLDTVQILMRGLRLRGIYVGNQAQFAAMNRAFSQHQVRPVIDRVFAWDQAPAAFAFMESGGHFGKIVIAVG